MVGNKHGRVTNNYILKNLLNRRSLSVIIILLIMCCLYNKTISHSTTSLEQSSVETFVYHLFMGYPSLGFSLMPFTSYMIVMCTPMFFICKYLEVLKTSSSIPYVIRFGDKRNFLNAFLKSSFVFIGVYFVIYMIVSFTAVSIFNFDVKTFETLTLEMLTGSLILKFLEIIFIFYLTIIIYAKTKDSIISFLSVLGAYVFSVNSIGLFRLNPFGLSSLSQWVEYEHGFGKVLIFYVIVIGIMHFNFKKKLSDKFI